MSEFNQPNYDPAKLWGRMRLTEAEIYFAALTAGYVGKLTEGEYEALQTGAHVTALTEGTDRIREPQVFGLLIDEIVDAVTQFEEAPGQPPSKIWEGRLIFNSSGDGSPGDEMFGFFGPGGFVLLVDSGPTDQLTDLRIKSGLLLRQMGEL